MLTETTRLSIFVDEPSRVVRAAARATAVVGEYPSRARLDGHETDPAVLHARCLELVALARALGPEALDRAKARL